MITLTVLTTVLTTVLVLAFGAIGSAKVAAAPAMRSRARHAGFSVAAYRRIGMLELLAASGLLVGVALPVIGVLAAVGLLLLLGGAVLVHLRNRDGVREMAPALVLALLAISLVVLVLGRLT
jgi:hypothetical protein